jgi:hypothetical protein
MNQYLEPEVQRNKFVPWVLFLCLSFFIISAGFYGIKMYYSFLEVTPQEVKSDDARPESMGRLYYSAVLPSESETRLFEVDFNNKVPTTLKNTEGIYHMSRFEHNKEALSRNDKEGKSFIEIISPSENGVEETSYVPAPLPDSKIGKIAWNEERTLLLYEVFTRSEDFEEDTRVTIYMYVLSDKSSLLLTEGQNPIFYDADTFLFMKNDGLYVLDLTASEDVRQARLLQEFVEKDNSLRASMIFSFDKKTLMVTRPSQRMVDVHTVEINDNQEIVFSSTGSAKQSMISPVFSPDERFIAFFEDEAATTTNEMMLSVTDIKTGNKTSVMSVLMNKTRPFVISFWK